jgi:hypothetical protein
MWIQKKPFQVNRLGPDSTDCEQKNPQFLEESTGECEKDVLHFLHASLKWCVYWKDGSIVPEPAGTGK